MSVNSKFKLRAGDEVTYLPGKQIDPILLTYVETMKNGMGRFFSSQFPTVEYHLAHDNDKIKPYDERYQEEVLEKYLVFKGNDQAKEQAYNTMLVRRKNHV